jgi:hypothetical protein
MADKINAIGSYRPRIVLGRTIEMSDLVSYIATRTSLNESGIRQVLLELRDAVGFFNLQGQAVRLEGLGTYTPTISVDGTFGVGHRADSALKNRLNTPGAFRGTIVNRENIGKTTDELIGLWNANHPEDQIAA